MNRLHLFEFEDLEWFPQAFRDMETDILQFYGSKMNPYGPVISKLKLVLEKLNCQNIIDLCSGGSGPLLLVQKELEIKENYKVDITLTDKFPNIEAFRKAGELSKGRIKYVETSVDATNVPANLKSFRTLFASFHHFKPESAKAILKDAVHKREGIGIFEFTNRGIFIVTSMLFLPIFCWLITPFIRPFSWRRLFWTYVIPVVPFVLLWNGTVSNLRTYSPEELERMTEEINCKDFTWEIGKAASIGAPKVTYLLGYPTNKKY